MARFQVTFQKIQNGKIVSTAGTSVEASSMIEASSTRLIFRRTITNIGLCHA